MVSIVEVLNHPFMRFSRWIVHITSWLWKMQIKLQIHHCGTLKACKIKNKTKKRQP